MNKEKIDALERFLTAVIEYRNCMLPIEKLKHAAWRLEKSITKEAIAELRVMNRMREYAKRYYDLAMDAERTLQDLRGKEQVRCGGCRFGDDYNRGGEIKCDRDYGWHEKTWYCADAEGK